MESVKTGFQVTQQGFSFPNSFDFPDFFQLKLPFIESGIASLDNLVYGLCGGMCFAALDYFHARATPPVFTRAEDLPWPYFLYFWQRQLHSLRKDVVPKLIKWMLSDDETLARNISRWEASKVIRRLKVGLPVVLVLVRVKGIADPTRNHQVLATGFEFDREKKDLRLFLYDPNHPGEQPELTMNLSSPGQGIHLVQSTGEALRGFFAIDYEQQDPPQK